MIEAARTYVLSARMGVSWLSPVHDCVPTRTPNELFLPQAIGGGSNWPGQTHMTLEYNVATDIPELLSSPCTSHLCYAR